MSIYRYEQLREHHIRLIELLPPSDSARIRIRIVQKSIQVEGRSYPSYEALSYCWGGELNNDEIEVVSESNTVTTSDIRTSKAVGSTGSLDDRVTLKVSRSVVVALSHLREQHATRTLWIDAICLNQNDRDEKDREIPNMGRIYRNAKQVILWLGVSTGRTAEAFEALVDLGRRVRWLPDEYRWEPLNSKGSKGRDWLKRKTWKNATDVEFEVPFKRGTWSAIEELLWNQCFRRVWIWQEICLATDRARNSVLLRCGMYQLPWQIFLNTIGFFYAEADISGGDGYQEEFAMSLKPVANIGLLPQQRHLLGLLGVTRRCGCTDPKDRIYGVLSLATQADKREVALLRHLRPDHRKTCEQVYRDLAVGEIQFLQRLNVLWNCDAVAWSDNLPSWVPDWRIRLPYSSLELGFAGGGRGDIFATINGTLLQLKGVFCDEAVKECSEMGCESLVKQQMALIIRMWCTKTFGRNQISDKDMVALCHAVTLGFIGNRYPEERRPVSLRDAKDIIGRMIRYSEPLPDKAPIVLHMMNAFPGRRLFITQRGRIGLGPAQCKPGDQIVSIIGSKQLLVLRAAPGERLGRFRIVGICYVHGLMDMEAILGPLPSEWSVQVTAPFSDPWNMRFVRNEVVSPQDPRLPDSYEGWQSEHRDEHGSILWNRTGDQTWTRIDPRHTDIAFLKRRGVAVEDIGIV